MLSANSSLFLYTVIKSQQTGMSRTPNEVSLSMPAIRFDVAVYGIIYGNIFRVKYFPRDRGKLAMHGQARGLAPSSLSVTADSVLLTTSASSVKQQSQTSSRRLAPSIELVREYRD